MPIKRYRPTTAGRRRASVIIGEIVKKEPEKSLVFGRKKKAGRDKSGRISIRHRGGGAKRLLRIVDFKQDKYNVPGKVIAIEYDPNRNAFLALLQYPDQEKRYIVAPLEMKVGDAIVSSQQQAPIQAGNRMPLVFIPVGMMVHNIELKPGEGGKLIRGAGSAAQLLAVEGQYVHLKLPSGEVRKVDQKCAATIGQVGNPDNRLVRLGKAGRMRWLGVRPRVRGKVMNPVDHPHGGGEGKCPIGLKGPKTPWGKPALGVKTRKKDKYSNFLILKRRK